jgi:hypothetical protein
VELVALPNQMNLEFFGSLLARKRLWSASLRSPGGFGQKVIEGTAVGSTERQFFLAAKNDDIFSAAAALNFRDGVEIDDNGAVDTNEDVGGERLLEVGDSFSNGEDARSGVDADIVRGGFDPVDFGIPEEDNLTLGANYEASAVTADTAQK